MIAPASLRLAAVLFLAAGAAAAPSIAGLSSGQTSEARPVDADLPAAFDTAVKAFMEEYRAADEKSRPALLADPVREPRHRFTPLFLEAAERHRGSPAALPFWTWLADNGTIVDPKIGERAVERILSDHLADSALAPAARAIGRAAGVRGSDRTIADLTRLIDGSSHPGVRAEALFQRAVLRRRSGSKDARADFVRAVADAPESPAGKRAEAELAAFSDLKVGDPAPELAGKTLTGESMSLSRLRGRVVLVDFWGMWCGPCVAQLPRLKALRERFAGKPFEVIGVNSDENQDAFRRFAATNRIDWVNVLDGSTKGPVATSWHVGAWPMNYLVDGNGVIRGSDLSFDAVDDQVAALLKGQ